MIVIDVSTMHSVVDPGFCYTKAGPDLVTCGRTLDLSRVYGGISSENQSYSHGITFSTLLQDRRNSQKHVLLRAIVYIRN